MRWLTRETMALVVLDEIRRRPELFPLLRSLVDETIRTGEKAGHFLVLGSTSRDRLRQSSETLAGRVAYLDLAPFTLSEFAANESDPAGIDRLWLRGGFPGSLLAGSDAAS